MGYEKFKDKKAKLIDFEDMITRIYQITLQFVDYKILMVDEAQDLTDLEWASIEK